MKTNMHLQFFVCLIITVLSFREAYSERYLQRYNPYPVPLGSDNILHWAGLTVTWRLNSNGSGDVTFAQTETAVQNAFNSWQNISNSSIGFSYGGSTSNTWQYDGQNVFYWAESGDPAHDEILADPQALAVTVIYSNSAAEIQDADVIFDGRDYQWDVTGGLISIDIESVAAHEIGRMIGMHHTEVSTSPRPTMYAGYEEGTTDQRSLEFDDIVGASFLYGGNLIASKSLTGTNYFDWSVTVYSGLTLTINAGGTVNFASGTSLTVNGSLIANSSDPNQRITFTGASSTPGFWNGIKLNSGSISTANTLRRCDIKYATTGLAITYTGGSNDETIDKCRISNNSSKGIYVNGNGYSSAWFHPTLSNNHIHNNSSSGITVSNYAKPLITGNQIEYNNAFGIEATSSYTGTVSYNRVANNGSNGMLFYSSSHAQVHRNTVEANSSGGVYIFSNSNVTAAGGGTAQGRNEITSNTGNGVYANTSSPNFGISNGYNWIQSNTSYEAQLVGTSGYQMRAENCYWGGGAPPAGEISGNVDYTPYTTTLPSPVGWGQSDGYDPSYLVQPIPDPIVALTPAEALGHFTASPATLGTNGASSDWTRDLIAAINAGLTTGDWTEASELITALHCELQDGRVPVVDFVLVATYANRSDVASPIRKMLALVLVENDLVANNVSAALAQLQNFRQSQSDHAAEFLASAGLVHLYRKNDVASAQSILAQLRTLAQNGDDIAAEHAIVFDRIIEDYLEYMNNASTVLQRPILAQAPTRSQPETSRLAQNYPNPFNPETTIHFYLNEHQSVRLVIYDLNGKHVRTLVEDEFAGGEHKIGWDGRNDNGQPAATGVYLYELATKTLVDRKKMTVLR